MQLRKQLRMLYFVNKQVKPIADLGEGYARLNWIFLSLFINLFFLFICEK